MHSQAKKSIDFEQEYYALKATVEHLEHQLAWFKKQLFGSKSERREPLEQIHGEQLSLLGDNAKKAPVPTRKVAAHERRCKTQDTESHNGFEFSADVPIKEVRLSDPSLKGLSADQYEVIDEKISYRLAQQPSSYVVIKYIRPVIKIKSASVLPECGAVSPKATQTIAGNVAAKQAASSPNNKINLINQIISVAAPQGVLGHSRADVSFIVGLLVDKFLYHLPLYRQHQRLLHTGIKVNRQWLTRIVHQSCALLRPIHEAVIASIISGHLIAMDEVPIKAGRKKKGKMKQGYYWPIYGEKDEVAFVYRPSRACKHVAEILGELKPDQVLLSDGYIAYQRYAQSLGIDLAQCWSHTRRKFIDAELIEPRLAEKALEMIRKLYSIEAQIREDGLVGEEKLAVRQAQSKPIVEQFFNLMNESLNNHHLNLLPSNPITKALAYARERKRSLCLFLQDPEIPLDTNHLERALRTIPLGRKNWLFCWTEIGAEYVGIAQTLIVSCRLHDIDPYDYLVDVLQRIDTHPASRVDELTPLQWKERFADNPLRSIIYQKQE